MVPALMAIALGAGSAGALAMDVRPASEAEMSGMLQGCWREEGSDTLPPQRRDLCFEAHGALRVSMYTCSEEHGCSETAVGGAYVVAGGKLNLDWDDIYRNVSCDVLIEPDRAFKMLNCTEPPVGLAVQDRSFFRLTMGAAN